MSQQQVMEILSNHPGQYLSIPDLCKFMNVNRNNVSRACKVLVKFGEVEFKTEKDKQFTRYLFAMKQERRYIYKHRKTK